MSVNEELQEHVEHAKEGFEKLIAANMAIVAALLAIVSVLGQHYNTEQLLEQQKSSDQWAYYQSKDIRRYVAQSTKDVLTQNKANAPEADRYQQDAARYKTEGAKIQEEAHQLERERDLSGAKAAHFHVGEVFLEVAIVLLSLGILTKRRPLAFAGFASALVGIVLSGRAFMQ